MDAPLGLTQSDLPQAVRTVVRWLMTDARRMSELEEFLDGISAQLRAVGVDVARITVGVPVLHPQIASVGGVWRIGQRATMRAFRHDDNIEEMLSASPIRVAYEGRGPVRCRLTDPPVAGEYPVLADLRAEGLTDYVVLSLPFTDGSNKAISFATARPGGFTETDIALFDTLVPAIAGLLEVGVLRRMARSLLDIYIGRQSDGHIRRGMGETIDAVIWLCDLRGFTALSEALPRQVLIDLLNGYFGPMCDAVLKHGGEVLKFIGDAMLAIFPVQGDPAGACRRALAAAEDAHAEIAEENGWRIQSGAPSIDYGIALHIGEVIYGNIGGTTRLDFTVIGPAVNLTARIENLCRDLQRPLLLSQDFAAASGADVESVGIYTLKGVGTPQQVFAPRQKLSGVALEAPHVAGQDVVGFGG
jgi:adenylate cyclase